MKLQNDAELMRHMLNLMETHHVAEPIEEKLLPVLGQKVKGALMGLAGKFSGRMEGRAVIQKALVPYLKFFVRNMGIRGKDWNTVTWKDTLLFLIGKASLQLPLGEFEPQQLSMAEVEAAIKDRVNRETIAKYLLNERGKINTLMPVNIRGAQNNPVGGPGENAADLAQKLITGLMTVLLRLMIEKSEGSPNLNGPAGPAGAAGAGAAGGAGAGAAGGAGAGAGAAGGAAGGAGGAAGGAGAGAGAAGGAGAGAGAAGGAAGGAGAGAGAGAAGAGAGAAGGGGGSAPTAATYDKDTINFVRSLMGLPPI